MKKNKGLWVGDFIQEQRDNYTDLYKGIKRNVDNNGYFEIGIGQNPKVKIYTTELAMILFVDEINGIKTFPCLESYTNAYNDGIEFFKKNHLPTTNILYGDYARLYVKDIHNNYFHTNHGNGVIGWNHIKNHYPLNLGNKTIEDFGYYAGIVSEVDIMIDSYFELFKELDKGCDCEDLNLKKGKKIKAPVLALFCKLINEIGIEKKEEIESVEKYCKRVCERYNLDYTDRVRQNFNGNETKANLNIFIEVVLPLLDIETKSKIQKHLEAKQLSKQNLYA